MAISDYILCCKCECKLLYDGKRANRDWWAERFGAEPQIKCPDCQGWQGLTQREIDDLYCEHHDDYGYALSATKYERAIEAKLKEKNHDL